MRRLFASAAVLCALAAPVTLQAQTAAPAAANGTVHPDFSGTWVLDTTHSQSPMPLPSSMTITIARSGDTLKVDRAASTVMGDVKSSSSLMLNGVTSKNTATQMGMTIESSTTVSWEGATMIAKTTADVGGSSLEQTDRWALSPDGKQLTINTDISAGGQSASAKLVLNKKS